MVGSRKAPGVPDFPKIGIVLKQNDLKKTSGVHTFWHSIISFGHPTFSGLAPALDFSFSLFEGNSPQQCFFLKIQRR